MAADRTYLLVNALKGRWIEIKVETELSVQSDLEWCGRRASQTTLVKKMAIKTRKKRRTTSKTVLGDGCINQGKSEIGCLMEVTVD